MYYTAERASHAGLLGAVSLFGLGVYGLTRVVYSVRRLILRKGGKNVTLVTYGLFGVNSKHVTVPLSSVRQFLLYKYVEVMHNPFFRYLVSEELLMRIYTFFSKLKIIL